MITASAPAKINLHLAVGPPRGDGFHAIQSLFVRLALADMLHIHTEEGAFSISVGGIEAYCAPGTDTLSRAARLWHEATGCDVKISVAVESLNPVQSGLGGPSSDAAALLTVLNTISPVERERLLLLGSQVGSDVPFFLFGGGAAIVEGRGEVVEPIAPRPLPVLLVMPTSLSVSTARAYEELDTLRAGRVPPFAEKEAIVARYNNRCSLWRDSLYNDFYATITHEPIYAALDALCADLDGYAMISGSGSCWYFVSEDEDCIAEARERVRQSMGDRVVWWQSHLIS